ncbi:MAG: AAA family ATPase, partial [Mycobacteriaceae bacterium]
MVQVLLVIDVCQAGAVSNEIPAEVTRDLPDEWTALLTSPAGVDAKVGAFTGVLAEVLADLRDGRLKDFDDAEPYLPSHILIAHLHERLRAKHGQKLVSLADPYKPTACLPNPRFDPSRLAAVPTTTARRDLAVLQSELDTYWTQRAPVVADRGTVFTGRRKLMTRLITFVAGPPGTLVVAGRAGCGKSAVLARLVTCSDELFREKYADVLVNAAPLPPERAVDVAVLATGKTQNQIAQQIAELLGARPPHEENLEGWISAISAAIRERSEPATVVIDALDEASDPAAVTLTLLERLNPPGRAQLRLVVGVRSSGTEVGAGRDRGRELADLVTIALDATRLNADADEFWESEDLAAYAGQLLARGDTPDAAQASLADLIADKAGRSYLLAGLVARHFAAEGDPGLVTATELDEVIARGVRDLVVRDLETTITDPAQRTRALLLLRAAALSFGRGIPWRVLWAQVATAIAADGRRVTQDDVGWLLTERASGYLVRDLEDGGVVYRPFHDDLRTELARGEPDDPNIATAHRKIAAALRATTAWDSAGHD